ncbi:MAG TPA: beta-galactosidase GalA [Candidatus Acidoferrales bacterium]|nr:beta-galactosidase GalA [Candidatus Acidoferrales bacterium]
MTKWTRRDLLKAGVVAPAAARALVSHASPEGSRTPILLQQSSIAPPSSPRERLLLDFGWRFHLGHADDPAQDFGFGRHSEFAKTGELFRPSRHDFDDSDWRAIDLPHDWAVELPFVDHASVNQVGAKPLGRAYPATSIGWYRNIFVISQSDLGRRLSLEFDGVFRDAIVSLNGNYVTRNLSGYAPFRCDITDFANYGGNNVLVVRADATEHEGWFYEGAGIYRHVWLVKTAPLHVAHWGMFVSSQLRGSSATVSITTAVENDTDIEKSCSVISDIFASDGEKLGSSRSSAQTVPAWSKRDFNSQIVLDNPRPWSLEAPHLYRATASIESEGKSLDESSTTFGIRDIRFDPDKGFFLNGKPVKIQGMCNHQDHAGVGSALPDRIQYFRIEKLKEMGVNAYRTSHNPPTHELLDACDRLGMLVMDETRMMSSNPEGLSQLERMVRRDRNHPCVILWSLGNEEPQQGTDRGARVTRTMKRLVRCLDPTRPVTAAMNGDWGKGISDVVDVQGFNYFNLGSVDKFHADFPAKPCVGSEEASTVSTRGIYENDKVRGYVSAYDLNRPNWGSLAEDWVQNYATRPFVSGAFVWTGFDYRGEPTPYGWPCISSHFGIMDTCGFPKDLFYYYQSWWTQKPVLHVFPHWNWAGKEGQEISVWVFSNCEEVELLLNGQRLGRQPMKKFSHVEWKVAYAPGALVARGFTSGKQIAESKRETTGAPAEIRLIPDRSEIGANGEDVCIAAVEILDAQGRLVPVADNKINFAISGPGKIIGVGNGDPSCHEPDKATERSAFNGLAQVIVQAQKQTGPIILSANSPGLAPASLTINSIAATPRPAA